jgi:hypothetical protein
MKNIRDIDYHERHKLQTYKLVVEREGQALSNSISHRKDKYKKDNNFVLLLVNSY